MLGLELTDEGFPRQRVEELLKEGEELGGFAIRPTSRAISDPTTNLGQLLFQPTLETDFMRGVGIIGTDNKPHGLITYKEGFRSAPRGEKICLVFLRKVRIPGRLAPEPGGA